MPALCLRIDALLDFFLSASAAAFIGSCDCIDDGAVFVSAGAGVAAGGGSGSICLRRFRSRRGRRCGSRRSCRRRGGRGRRRFFLAASGKGDNHHGGKQQRLRHVFPFDFQVGADSHSVLGKTGATLRCPPEPVSISRMLQRFQRAAQRSSFMASAEPEWDHCNIVAAGIPAALKRGRMGLRVRLVAKPEITASRCSRL